jgi:hypothetical protein
VTYTGETCTIFNSYGGPLFLGIMLCAVQPLWDVGCDLDGQNGGLALVREEDRQ